MHGTYNPWLVALSLAVATLAAYTALDLSGRIALLSHGRRRHAWIAGGGMAMGIGIWSMHFIGVMSFSLPIPLGYDFAITGASLAIAIVVSWFALYVISRASLSPGHLVASAILMGLGIAGMHYTGDAAMKMQPAIAYDAALVAGSIGIAIGASGAALWISQFLNAANQRQSNAKRVAGACVMGIAITGMHYTANAAATFLPGSICGATQQIATPLLATAVTLSTLAILIVTLVLSRSGARTSFLASVVSRLNGEIVRMAQFDELTDLPNRRTLMERIEAAIQTERQSNTTFAVLFMDLDGFKTINDSLGHTAGDEVLKAFARRLQQCVRASDTVARLGGDEFVVLLENVSSIDDVERAAEHVLNRMRDGLWNDAQPLQVTPSIGIALYPRDGDTVEVLLKHADVAMYEAKRAGRSTYRFFQGDMNVAVQRTLQVQRALHEAVVAGYFELHFQPKFHGRSGAITGAEALLRLNHPELGTLMPAEFIPIAERTGQIVQIGYWVVRETCRQLNRWRADGLPALQVAINLSPRQIAESGLVSNFLEILSAEGVKPAQLMFEITESVAMQDAAHTTAMIHEFQTNGFEVAIDDFGTGYSSLSYLQRFRAKQLKIDRFFTHGLDKHNPEGSAIVRAIIALAHTLKMDVVAEGVETASQLAQLKILMCDEVQGFLLGHPLEPDAFGSLLRNGAYVESA
ncbi:putative bifunctional diguanylate cyclase/phosphodiesterase [Burkholderia latens]|uniref:Diguanylate cyclase/phosphodiesterase n=1 Tax=Burkholderia latens TaxID=488446 RepID=A0A6H9TCB0_9BURK|nr:EAL domain-containing protein [Burkholderia latens]KAB0641064.1 EAL domain-containing protein [Burkholderia latens]VWB11621.1 diguanylate cyclase/phosphodiesterase [Burkholderia latens]